MCRYCSSHTNKYSDIYRVDEILARTFNMLFVNVAKSGFTLAVISISTPAFVSLIIPLGLMYIFIQRYYLYTSRELKRLDSVSRSPIFAHFQESLGGVQTIRAYRQQSRFELENEWRMDSNLRAYFPSISSNRWLAVRLEFIGAIVILAAAGFSVVSVANYSGLTSGMVGLAMSYALQITTSLNWIVRQSVEVETNIVSVERVLEYAALPSEAPEIIARNRPPVSWPVNGEVEFRNYSARYREGLDLVLKNISIDIKPHEKIGVVGRTGAGKSSLTLALFRIIEPDTGHIRIDDLNTSTIGLLDLRRRLAIIPQDAALFEGTVRDNLDPAHVHDDTELWTVLEHARLKDHVTSMTGGLEARINEGGMYLLTIYSSFSFAMLSFPSFPSVTRSPPPCNLLSCSFLLHDGGRDTAFTSCVQACTESICAMMPCIKTALARAMGTCATRRSEMAARRDSTKVVGLERVILQSSLPSSRTKAMQCLAGRGHDVTIQI